MAKEQPEKLTGTSLDISAENCACLKQLFPTVFTETKNDNGVLVESIDFEKLKAELGTFSDIFESRRERYGMDWPGKKDALRLIQTPSHATLKPCREESMNFDKTENLFIEGDNLEVLKLLQKSYYGKIKMIYIDPPYNTGKEFIYPDNYTESLETYLEYAGLIDSEGKKFSTNTANEGRFHTKWLNMMYPRLYLARNLLCDDGVIFMSIDDNEVSNLKNLCDEIFGEENFTGIISWLKKRKGSFLSQKIISVTEYILIYSKQPNIKLFGGKPSETESQPLIKRTNAISTLIFPKNYVRTKLKKSSYKKGKYGEGTSSVDLINDIQIDNGIITTEFSLRGPFTWSQKNLDEQISKSCNIIINTENFQVRAFKIQDENASKGLPSILIGTEIHATNEDGYEELIDIFKIENILDYPKPSNLISYLINAGTHFDSNSIILDFFAGSATTAHAILNLNKENGGTRRFIMVQLPEPCAIDSVAFKAGYKTIAEIGKERIRRVIKKLNEEQKGKLNLEQAEKQDRGFKVLKLDKSNFKQWQNLAPSTPPEQIAEQLELHIDHIDNKSTQEDLLYEILLKAGFAPTEKIEVKTIASKKVFSVAEGALLLCLEDEVKKEFIDAVTEAEPMQFICLDSAFHGKDQLKTNAVQTFAARNMQKEKHNQIVFKTV